MLSPADGVEKPAQRDDGKEVKHMTPVAIVKLIFTIIEVLAALFLIAVVLLQSGKSAGLSGSIAGGVDSFMSKTRAKGWDAKLARWTKYVAIAWIILALVLNILPNA